MPEALFVAAVFFISVVIYVAMWVQSRNPALYDPRRKHARLEQHVGWLKARLTLARDEGWGDEMVAPLAADLTATA